MILMNVFSCNASLPEIASVREPSTGDIRLLIVKIHYEGTDAYSIVVSITNASSKDVLIRALEEGFFLQTNRGWTHLEMMDDEKGRRREGILIPHNQKKEMVALISIAGTIPDLFRTYEGDLSLMYKYTYAIQTLEDSGTAFQREDEIYCWVKPGTSQWILREGM